MKSFFYFYNSIRLVRGSGYNLIYDLDHGELFKLDLSIMYNDQLEVIDTKENFKNLDELREVKLGIFSEKRINKLIENPINLQVNFAFDICTLIYRFTSESVLERILNSIPQVFSFVILINNVVEDVVLMPILSLIEDSEKVSNLEICLNYSNSSCELLKANVAQVSKLSKVVFFNSTSNRDELLIIDKSRRLHLIFVSEMIDFKTKHSFNYVHPEYLSINRASFAIAQKSNLFYYKKYYVDDKGNLYKNEDDRNLITNLFFGEKIKEDLIFEENNNILSCIAKDNIEGCKNSPFRYCCNDPRVPFYDEVLQLYHYENKCLCEKYL